MSTTVSVRLDESIKEDAVAVLDELGLDMSTAIRMFVKQIADTRSVPLSLTLNEGLVGESYRRKLDSSIAAFNRGETFARDLVEAEG